MYPCAKNERTVQQALGDALTDGDGGHAGCGLPEPLHKAAIMERAPRHIPIKALCGVVHLCLLLILEHAVSIDLQGRCSVLSTHAHCSVDNTVTVHLQRASKVDMWEWSAALEHLLRVYAIHCMFQAKALQHQVATWLQQLANNPVWL